jgi:AraC-like DNA-binding protein
MVKKNSQPAYIDAVKKSIEANFKHPLNIHYLAKLAGVSESTLQHQFPDAFGVTMQEYQTDFRIKIAKYLLEDTDHAIKYIAQNVGYKSAPSFSHAFKKITGKKPSDYRKEVNP